MRNTGIFFILASLFLVGAVAVDLVFVRPHRHRRQIETLDNVHDDLPDTDPALYKPGSEDVTEERFMLNAEEMDFADRGEDYEYVIQDGDTIDELARKFLGRHELKAILQRENAALVPGRKLEPGTTITIPFRFRR